MFVDIHVIQSVPPSNINRDDTGSPKTAYYGGVLRSRVSSQAWKKAVRGSFATTLKTDDLGVRTKQAVEKLVGRMTQLQPEIEAAQAQSRAKLVLEALGMKVDEVKLTRTQQKAVDAGEASAPAYGKTQYLVFWSNRQLDRLARLALDTEGKPSKAHAKAAADEEHGIEVALFGRMVADAADLNVDAAVQVAHAISTHAVTPEQDYYTAVDDANVEEETGAGMIGVIEFNSSTLYRFATVDVAGLHNNLGDPEATARAVEAFVNGFVASMPTGKQNTFANRTVPEAVLVCVREDRPVNLVGAFEDAVDNDGGFTRPSVARLVAELASVSEMGFTPAAVFTARGSDRGAAIGDVASPLPLPDLVASVGAAVRGSFPGGSQ
ncbi:MAG: type I-E CRISPR-associated protein Cas7/Cse4/CasC [Tetrasphaera sp.]